MRCKKYISSIYAIGKSRVNFEFFLEHKKVPTSFLRFFLIFVKIQIIFIFLKK
nr:MAG TPA: hypothetical protein [Bacteriophage sp.]